MTGIKIDELRPIVKSLNDGKITYGKAIKLINERLVFSALEHNAELSGENRRLLRASKRVLNFYESFRLKALHLMDDKEIKESHDCLTELNELLESE